jgi:hypothetical protein
MISIRLKFVKPKSPKVMQEFTVVLEDFSYGCVVTIEELSAVNRYDLETTQSDINFYLRFDHNAEHFLQSQVVNPLAGCKKRRYDSHDLRLCCDAYEDELELPTSGTLYGVKAKAVAEALIEMLKQEGFSVESEVVGAKKKEENKPTLPKPSKKARGHWK